MSNSESSTPCKKCNITFETLSEAHSVDLESRLRSNYSSSSTDRTQISELLSKIKNDAARCDAEISRLHSLIISLENMRQQLRSRSNACSSLLSPIRRLPVELLVQIFSYCSGCNDLATGEDERPQLLTLNAVCASWRSIISSTPKLWSTITVDRNFQQRGLGLLKMYVQRSKQSPLSIKAGANCDMDFEAPVMECLIPHSRRWVDVDLHLCDSQLLNETFSALKGNMPLVERLYLGLLDLEATDYTIFESMPRLHTLSLLVFSPNILLPWEQVIHFSLSITPLNQFSLLLARFPRMETARLEKCLVQSHHRRDEDEVTITSPYLHALSLSISTSIKDSNILSTMFTSATLPSLRSLSIEDTNHLQKWPQDSFSSFLSRSSCTITKISLTYFAFSDADLLGIFSLLPWLTDLTLQDQLPETSDSTIQSLRAHSSAQSFDFARSVLLPKLESIRLRAHGTAFTDQSFVDMVKSRWLPAGRSGGSGIACLRSVNLHVTRRRFDYAKSESLRHLAKAGMRIAVNDSEGFVDICADFV